MFRSPRFWVLAALVWFVVAWNLFDPLSTIVFEPIKDQNVVDNPLVTLQDRLFDRFMALLLLPPVGA